MPFLSASHHCQRTKAVCDLFHCLTVSACVVVVIICAAECVSELMDMYEYHSLLCLLCPDFPLSVVQQAARYDA